jgi:LmbE family N-acetylglucosaminyl deacetylase
MLRDYLRHIYRTATPLLYSRRRFKLFLNASLGDINLRMLALASSTDYFSQFVRPIPIQAPFGNSMLVVAPHQDDEAIGCGGALALQARSGRSAGVVILQDGGDEHEAFGMTRAGLTELRNEESRRASAVLDLPEPIFLNYANLADSVEAATEKLRGVIADRKADAIFVPFVLDAHPDHRTTNYILAKALEQIPSKARVFGYEVWGLSIPNVLVVIDHAMEDKLRMISCFESANKAVDYVRSTEGINMYHSRMLGAGCAKYVERFFELPREEYIALVERVRVAQLSG